MKTQIKVGDTFEVVEILSYDGYINAFVPHKTTLKYMGGFICNHESYRNGFVRLSMLDIINRLHLSDSEVKPIGRLTITKVK